ncbi:uncharacterized protein METZ01_LOCUS108513, partial [marine metagenome]
VLHGTQVNIDVSKLSYDKLDLIGAGTLTGATGPMPFILMPGAHGLTMATGRGPEPGFDFTVAADGILQFDPSLDSLIGGRGTRDIVLHGTQVNIDVSKLSYDKLDLIGAGTLTGATGPMPFILMPGAHGLTMATGHGPEPGFDFTVEAAGIIQFDPSLDSLIGGRGTRNMMLHGTRISIDARGMRASFAVEGLAINPVEQILIANFMPGAHRLRSSEIDFVFTVTPDLTVDYGTELDEGVSGRGTPTLIVNGHKSGYDPARMIVLTAFGDTLGAASRLIQLRQVISN